MDRKSKDVATEVIARLGDVRNLRTLAKWTDDPIKAGAYRGVAFRHMEQLSELVGGWPWDGHIKNLCSYSWDWKRKATLTH